MHEKDCCVCFSLQRMNTKQTTHMVFFLNKGPCVWYNTSHCSCLRLFFHLKKINVTNVSHLRRKCLFIFIIWTYFGLNYFSWKIVQYINIFTLIFDFQVYRCPIFKWPCECKYKRRIGKALSSNVFVHCIRRNINDEGKNFTSIEVIIYNLLKSQVIKAIIFGVKINYDRNSYAVFEKKIHFSWIFHKLCIIMIHAKKLEMH